MKRIASWVAAAAVLSFTLAPSLAHAQAFRPGVLPLRWETGYPDCSVVEKDFQVWKYNDDFYILRESGCVHDEKPFLFILFGQNKALLLDTGAGPDSARGTLTGRIPDVVKTVDFVIGEWLKRNNRTSIHLVVTHLHGHPDHTFADPQYAVRPDTDFIPPRDVPALQSFFGIQHWPTDIVSYDLGNRVVDIIPIPGHEIAHIAVYDRQTAVLLTGDTLYPGRVYVNQPDPDIFQASVQRLVDFTATRKVAHVLGTHIEQRRPYLDWVVGTHEVPEELPLELSRGNLLELLNAAKQRTHPGSGGLIPPTAFRDFSICGVFPTCDRVNLP
jgi:hydroxyacylglutathione hydrolase